MKQPLATGDRIAWTERDRGIIVAADPQDPTSRRRFTVAVWHTRGFSGHVTRLPASLLHRTSRLQLAASPRIQPDGHA